MTTRTTMPPDHSRMPPRRGRPRATLVMTAGAVASVAVALAACSGGDPAPPPTSNQATAVISQPGPSPTPSPSVSIPANLTPAEAEAAANAVEAYKKWIAAVDEMTQSGGKNLSSVKEYAVQVTLINNEQEAAMFARNEWRTVGNIEIRKISVESVDLTIDKSKNKVPEVLLEACVDASKTDAVDASGISVIREKSRVFNENAWIRRYPQSDYRGVGKGVNGWLVGQSQNQQASSC